MDLFIKSAAGVLITAVLCLSLSKQGKDISLLLTIAVCCMVIVAAMTYLQPVLDFIQQLQTMGNIDAPMIKILLKALGLCMLAELAGWICTDANNAALARVLQLLVTAGVLWLAIPLFTQLLELLEKIMGAI